MTQLYYRDGDVMKTVSTDNPLPVTGGGGGGSDGATAANQESQIQRMIDLQNSFGFGGSPAVVNPALEANIIALMKGVLSVLLDIKTNTTPSGG